MVVFHPAFGFDFVGMEGSQVTRLGLGFGLAGSLALACCVLGGAVELVLPSACGFGRDVVRGNWAPFGLGSKSSHDWAPFGLGSESSRFEGLTVISLLRAAVGVRVRAPLCLQLRECNGFLVS